MNSPKKNGGALLLFVIVLVLDIVNHRPFETPFPCARLVPLSPLACDITVYVCMQEGAIPADEAVLTAYDDCLREEQGHFTSIDTLVKVSVAILRRTVVQ